VTRPAEKAGNAGLVERIVRESERTVIRARNGVRYLSGSEWAPPRPTPSDVVWRQGTAELRRYRNDDIGYAEPVVMFIGLVSRSYILDLHRRSSVAHRLAEAAWTCTSSTGASRGLRTRTTRSRPTSTGTCRGIRAPGLGADDVVELPVAYPNSAAHADRGRRRRPAGSVEQRADDGLPDASRAGTRGHGEGHFMLLDDRSTVLAPISQTPLTISTMPGLARGHPAPADARSRSSSAATAWARSRGGRSARSSAGWWADVNASSRRRIYLLRHGEVAYYADPAQPVVPEEAVLTNAGLDQARAAGRALANVGLVAEGRLQRHRPDLAQEGQVRVLFHDGQRGVGLGVGGARALLPPAGVPGGQGPVPHDADAAEGAVQHLLLLCVGVCPASVGRSHPYSIEQMVVQLREARRACCPQVLLPRFAGYRVPPRPEGRGILRRSR
jgi:hypothetical protein